MAHNICMKSEIVILVAQRFNEMRHLLIEDFPQYQNEILTLLDPMFVTLFITVERLEREE